MLYRRRKPFPELPVKSDFVEPLRTMLETEDWEKELTPCVKGCEGSGQSPGRESGLARGWLCRATISTARSTGLQGRDRHHLHFAEEERLRLGKVNEAAEGGVA